MTVSILLRATKGSPLTNAEVDANFSALADGVNLALSSSASYTLPTASSSTLGGIRVGSGLSIDSSGVLSATGGTSSGVSSFNGRAGAVNLLSSDVTSALGYTPANSANVVTSVNGRTGTVVLSSGDVTSALGYSPAGPGGVAIFVNLGTATWTVPAGVTTVYVTGSGGGGGGLFIMWGAAGSRTQTGGHGQVCYKKAVAVTPGASLSITVGAGGAGRTGFTTSATSADAGLASSVGSLLVLAGGNGGGVMSDGGGYDGFSPSAYDNLYFKMPIDNGGVTYGQGGGWDGDAASPVAYPGIQGYIIIEW